MLRPHPSHRLLAPLLTAFTVWATPVLLGLLAFGACAPDAVTRPDADGARPLDPAAGAAGAQSDTIPGEYLVMFRTDVIDPTGLAEQLASEAARAVH